MEGMMGDGSSLRTGVILPAAGMGTRLGGQPKQYRSLGDTPLLLHTVSVFDHHPDVHHIVVVVKSGDERTIEEDLRAAGNETALTVTAGGVTRQASVAAGLEVMPSMIDIVLVHDAVRPFLSGKLVSRVITAIQEYGAAALALPVTDTLRQGAEQVFGNTVERDGMFRMQTPQGSRMAWLRKAHEIAKNREHSATDDVDLLQYAGFNVRYVEGSSLNFKITTPADWSMANWLWPSWVASGKAGLSSNQ